MAYAAVPQCNGSCKYGGICNCSYAGQQYYVHSNPGSMEQQVASIHQTIQSLSVTITTLTERMQGLEDMMVDVNAGIDEILAQRTFNSDEKVCRCAEEGRTCCVSGGDSADSAEPSSSG